jgi:hypothetical protein
MNPSRVSAGIALILIGVILLTDNLFELGWWVWWPLLLIIPGGLLIWKSIKHNRHNGGMHESFES